MHPLKRVLQRNSIPSRHDWRGNVTGEKVSEKRRESVDVWVGADNPYSSSASWRTCWEQPEERLGLTVNLKI